LLVLALFSLVIVVMIKFVLNGPNASIGTNKLDSTFNLDADALLAFPIATFNFNAQPYMFAICFDEMEPAEKNALLMTT